MFRRLLNREQGRFVDTPGLDPTNNRAERMLRPGVIWRKKSFGCQYVQRMLSANQTLRLRNADVLDYLPAAVAACRMGVAPPPFPIVPVLARRRWCLRFLGGGVNRLRRLGLRWVAGGKTGTASFFGWPLSVWIGANLM